MIDYSEGDVEFDILNLLKQSQYLGADNDIAQEQYSRWSIKYHLTKLRANCLRHLVFEELDVLELGAGMGGVSRYLAENSRSLTAVEGTRKRCECLKERLRDLHNWNAYNADYMCFNTDKRYDVVCFLGVLEYAGKYINTPNPFADAINQAKKFLKPDGVLLITIENKNGLKYLAGATEDHYNQHFYGICGYPECINDIKTFSRKELSDMLYDAGFVDCEIQHLFPDYKLTRGIVTDEFVNKYPNSCADIISSYNTENYTGNNVKLFPEQLLANSLGKSGILAEFTNSHLFIASNIQKSITKEKLLSKVNDANILGCIYSHSRKNEIETSFVKKDGKVLVLKQLLSKVDLQENNLVEYNLQPMHLLPGTRLSTILINWAYYQNWNEFLSLLKRYLVFAFDAYKNNFPDSLAKESLDAVIRNTIFNGENSFENFDLEFIAKFPITKSYFIFRNIYSSLVEIIPYFKLMKFITYKELYFYLCKEMGVEPAYEIDLQQEVVLQNSLTVNKIDTNYLHNLFERKITSNLFNIPVDGHKTLLSLPFINLRKNKHKIIVYFLGMKLSFRRRKNNKI